MLVPPASGVPVPAGPQTSATPLAATGQARPHGVLMLSAPK